MPRARRPFPCVVIRVGDYDFSAVGGWRILEPSGLWRSGSHGVPTAREDLIVVAG
jgi:hypothetical protein